MSPKMRPANAVEMGTKRIRMAASIKSRLM
jgi:hypothetical protein